LKWLCADGKEQIVHPILSAICADLMEAMYYTGTRSSGGKYPCPMCLVPNTELSRLKKSLGNAYTI